MYSSRTCPRAVCALCAQVPRAVPPGEQPPVVRERGAALHPGLVGHARRRGPACRQVHTQRSTFTIQLGTFTSTKEGGRRKAWAFLLSPSDVR